MKWTGGTCIQNLTLMMPINAFLEVFSGIYNLAIPLKIISVKIKNSAKSLNDQRPFKIFKAEAKIVQKILKNNNPR